MHFTTHVVVICYNIKMLVIKKCYCVEFYEVYCVIVLVIKIHMKNLHNFSLLLNTTYSNGDAVE